MRRKIVVFLIDKAPDRGSGSGASSFGPAGRLALPPLLKASHLNDPENQSGKRHHEHQDADNGSEQ
jgi:hypothetical protein